MSKTQQQIFDIAYRGLASQGFKRSLTGYDDLPSCMYRGDGGMKCAVGWLIPDEFYFAGMEGRTASDPSIMEVCDVGEDEKDFVDELQDAHDMGDTPIAMQENLEGVAALYKLKIPEAAA